MGALINSLKIASPNPSKIFVATLANSNSNYFVHIFLIIGVAWRGHDWRVTCQAGSATELIALLSCSGLAKSRGPTLWTLCCFYLNTIKQLLLFVDQLDQLEVYLSRAELLKTHVLLLSNNYVIYLYNLWTGVLFIFSCI